MPVLIVLTNVPDAALAQRLAERLLEERCAACVNILAPCTSVYRWQGALEHGTEVPLLVKTTDEHYAAVERVIQSMHPYELPEIIAVPAMCGLSAYLAWVEAETSTSSA